MTKCNNLKDLSDLCFNKRKNDVHSICKIRTELSAEYNNNLRTNIAKRMKRQEQEQELRILLLGCIGGILKTINKK